MTKDDSMGSEIQDLKDDLVDALKENERLQAELAEAYNADPEDEHERQLVTTQEFEALKFNSEAARVELSRMQTKLDVEREYYSASGLDLVKALAILETVAINGGKSWEYFKTTRGRGELEWAHNKYRDEMQKIFNEHGRS